MKKLQEYILEDFKLKKKAKITGAQISYSYHPKDKDELRKILKERLSKDKDADLNDIDVSNINDMCYRNPQTGFYGLFYDLDPHNIDISGWNMSNVEDISYMFYNCTYFNSDLSEWDVSNVEDMTFMFYGCKNFNINSIYNWNVTIKGHDGKVGMFKNSNINTDDYPYWYKSKK